MLVDKLDYFLTESTGLMDLTTDGTTALTSDSRYYPPEGKYADGTGEKIVEVLLKTRGTSAVSFTIALVDSADDSTFAVVQSASVLDAALIAGATVIRWRLPAGLRKYVAVRLTGVTAVGNFVWQARIVHG